jgi:hypothetical protein
MQPNNNPGLERPMLLMGSVSFIAGLAIIAVSTVFSAHQVPENFSSTIEQNQIEIKIL